MTIEFIWLVFSVLIAYTSLGLSGFGAVVTAITLGAHAYPIEVLLPVIVFLTTVSNIYISGRYRAHISWTVLLKKIVPFMGIGFAIGVILFNILHGEILKKGLGVLVALLSARELVRLLKHKNDSGPLSRFKSFLYIFSAGIVQGVYSSGGPLLVYAVSKLNLSKSIFRSTMSIVWVIFCGLLALSYYLTGKLTLDSIKMAGMLVPAMIAGIFIGEKLHTRVNEHIFKIIVSSILLFAGTAIVLR